MDPRLGRALIAAAAVCLLALPLAYAQQNEEAAGLAAPANEAPPVIMAPPANEAPPSAEPFRSAPPVAQKPPAPPPPPPGPVRSPTAILRVLDKVTAETLRFEAPVGRRVRYKTLIFLVKACETRGLRDPLPRPSAYVVIDSEPTAPQGRQAPEAREVFRGWMFADSPGLHPFEHPVYDTWLEACTADTPPA